MGGYKYCPFHWYNKEGVLGETHPSMTSLSVLFCFRYEEEVSLRATAENEFVALKKVSNMGLGSTDMRVSDGQSS